VFEGQHGQTKLAAKRDFGPFTGVNATFKRVARAWTRKPRANSKIFFSIPLAGKSDQLGWERRCSLLGQTLRSILNQTDADFTVLIAAHEQPEIEEIKGKPVKVIKCSFDKPTRHPQFSWNKRRKRIEMLSTWLSKVEVILYSWMQTI
jgi:hypothetical protein